MRIESINPYNQKLIGLSKKAKAESELLGVKKSPLNENAGESMRSEQDAMKIRRTCLEISRRIISGDEVPQKDHKYLMKHDMELYARSISLRRHKEDPHKYKQLSEDEKPNTPQSAMNTQAPGGSENPVPVPLPKLDESI